MADAEPTQDREPGYQTGRMEAFSDGVSGAVWGNQASVVTIMTHIDAPGGRRG
jgi:hypothetical protein